MVSNLPTNSGEESTNPSNDVKISLCIPSSVISQSNASNLEHITHVAYQIAKAATIYNVVEIVTLEIPSKRDRQDKASDAKESQISLPGDNGNKKIKFNSVAEEKTQSDFQEQTNEGGNDTTDKNNENNALLLASLLQYFVTPKYLVKSVFRNSPHVKKFKYAEKLPTLTALPFMKNEGVRKAFKEGFTVAKQAPKIRKKSKKSSAVKKLRVTKYVNIGDSKLFELSGPEVPTNVRVTVDLKNKRVVSPESAYAMTACKASYGYHVRLAKTVTSVFTELSHADGYTESIFVNADNFFGDISEVHIPEKKNDWQGQILLVIGSLNDLEYVFNQESIDEIDSIAEMFDGQMIVPPGLRIEDAAFVSLAKL
ncbi:DUF171-domain-containing protein [Metschnikowia bicuspidata var. bicuspidata NRRL YB-4993]|uniref:DUF171-domain-containing protein n=1 Tax=Metschnikowia bicuspidata var. bicuspidata NRRL YB-4993 TaxID=869754 RepID=A0A1A0HDR2_9ASCO|nr:DUF171-domain-containing protein [Metschnikowia bicuspidata var. bicuspidata NRRL YB-4993]OBA22224.1 DUF171-domain-containing protein [Metschnikowia bicuspidata var. bicuspidata NRRL YB-4993]